MQPKPVASRHLRWEDRRYRAAMRRCSQRSPSQALIELPGPSSGSFSRACWLSLLFGEAFAGVWPVSKGRPA